MCFAPYISLSTFVIEFLLAVYFLLKNPKDKLNQIIALLSFLLSIYQLNEFLICVTQLSLFTRFAMITTAILPAVALSYALVLLRRKLRYYWHILIYSPALFFIVVFSIANYYRESAECMAVFIEYPTLGLIGDFYALYYIIYILSTATVLYLAAGKIRSKREIVMLKLGMLSMFIFTVPTFIFIVFLPMLYVQFPSVLCEFALLLAIEFIVMLWYKDKHRIKY